MHLSEEVAIVENIKQLFFMISYDGVQAKATGVITPLSHDWNYIKLHWDRSMASNKLLVYNWNDYIHFILKTLFKWKCISQYT